MLTHYNQIHPITGQGGNQAIISSAYLANKLDELNGVDPAPDNQAIEKAFMDYQNVRGSQAKASIKAARFLQWTGSLETPISAFLQRHVVSKISTEGMLVRFAQATTSAVPLKYMPMPSRKGTIPWNDEIALKPQARSAIATIFWVGLLYLTMIISYKAVENAEPALLQETEPGTESRFPKWFITLGLDGSQTKELHFNMSVTAVALCMCIDSHRFFIPKALSR